ncbi:MAG TPA: VOC family protein [Candidatus Acidoferrales bacterium]|nr:VOC family protein [Candidatus Acidoferrales bacterium]
MAEQNQAEQFDRLVDAILAKRPASPPDSDAELAALANLTADLRGLPPEKFKQNLKMDLARRASMSSKPVSAPEPGAREDAAQKSQPIPSRYPTIAPYLVVRNAAAFIEFLQAAFGGKERFRAPAGPGGKIMHAEVEVGNAVVELADANPKFPSAPQALHLYVREAVDEVFSRAVSAGATAIHPPQDMEWGDRMGTVRDAFDNIWYVSMPKGWTPGPEGLRAIQPYLHLRGADWMITFLEQAFDAKAEGVAKSEEGNVLHATIQIGDWTLEVDEAHAQAQPMPGHFHLHVPDADALYARAMAAGAASIEAPSDKPYGRSGGVRDPFGNSWIMTTFPATAAQRSSAPSSAAKTAKPEIGRAAHAVASPRLTFKDPAKAIEFYTRALGAREKFRFEAGGRIAHAEIAIGDSIVNVAGEWPEGGRFSAETLGNSPVWMSLQVDDVDAFTERAVSGGMTLKRPIQDQFYGHRDALLTDPFGYNWGVYTVKEEISVEEMHRRMQEMMAGTKGGQRDSEDRPKRPSPIPAGFRTLQPYIVAANGEALVQFAKQAFGAEEISRAIGSAGGLHTSVRIGDTMLMMGGGIPGRPFSGKPYPVALHVYVKDTDAAYAKALAAGGVSIDAPQDHEYGERGASVKDPAGNFWYIATATGESYIPHGLHNVNIYMHPLRAEPVISFVRRAFGAEEIAKYASPDGVVHHAQVRIGDTVLEMGEAHGVYQPMQSMFYLYVPDVDAVYRTALAAGAQSILEPKDQPYGDRNAGITDPFGNAWYIATHIRDAE